MDGSNAGGAYGVGVALLTLVFTVVVLDAALLPVFLHLNGVAAEETLGWLVPTSTSAPSCWCPSRSSGG